MSDTQLSIQYYLDVVRRQLWLVILTVATVVFVTALVSLREQPVYRASMKIVVGQRAETFQAQLGSDVARFTSTMTNLLESNVVAETVIENLDLETTPASLLAALDVSIRPESSVLEVGYESTDKEELVPVLDEVGDVFTSLVAETLGGDGSESGVPQVSATVFDAAFVEPGQVSPQPLRSIAIGTVLGGALGLIFAFLRDSLDSRIRGRREAEEWFEAPVIGLLPKGSRGRRPADVVAAGRRHDTKLVEALHIVRANLEFARSGSSESVTLVTSALPEEGKSTLVADLGVILALSGKDVICVEADLRRPKLMDYLGLKPQEVGLVDVLQGDVSLSEALHSIPVFVPQRNESESRRSTSRPKATRSHDGPVRAEGRLRLLPSGVLPSNPTTLLTPERVSRLIADLREQDAQVIFDAPPLLLVADAFPLATQADRVIIVARHGRTTRANAEAVRATLLSLGVDQLSIVLTDSSGETAYGYDYAYDTR